MSTTLIQSHELTDEQFEALADLIRRKSGINLRDGKQALVRARLAKRLRSLRLTSFGAYLRHVENDPTGDEMVAMIDALCTNTTGFFREHRHFDYLAQTALPKIMQRNRKSRRLRIWSAGCSSGEEPYSIAATVHRTLEGQGDWDVGLLATDLSSRALARARQGVYAPERLAEVAPSVLLEDFTPLTVEGRRVFRVAHHLRKMISFARLNLIGPWPMTGPFDVIFCRNVMIYFDKPTQAALVDRFWDYLDEGGLLLVGHSESLTGVAHKFRYVQPTIYEKA